MKIMTVKFSRKCLKVLMLTVNSNARKLLHSIYPEISEEIRQLRLKKMRRGFMLRLVNSAFQVLTFHNCICTSGGGLHVTAVWLEVLFDSNDPFPEF
jgi:hypothetical protein